MYIPIHTKTEQKPVGYICTWCPICRDASTFAVVRFSTRTYVALTPIGVGTHVHDITTCQTCSLPVRFLPGEITNLAPDPPADPLDIAHTSPGGDDVLIDRMNVELEAASGRLGPGERQQLLANIAIYLEHSAASEINRHMGRPFTVLFVVGMILLSITLIGLACAIGFGSAASFSPVFTTWQLPIAVALGLFGLSGAIGVIIWSNRRAKRLARAALLPRVRQAFLPINARPDELAMTFTTASARAPVLCRLFRDVQIEETPGGNTGFRR